MKGIFLTKKGFAGSLLMSALLILAGCSLAPKYEVPSTPTTATFKEAPQQPLSSEETGTWKTAQPSEDVARGEWWTVFEDAKLNELEQQALDANQNLKAAAARVKEARAMNQAARAGLFPSLDAGFGPTRQRVSAASLFESDGTNVPQQTFWRAQASASYEVDLFGRVASTVDAARADTQRSEALFRSVMLALQADVAQNYFALRELDAESEVFKNAVDLRQQALNLVQRRYSEGEITELDLSRAKAELATAQSDAMTVQRLRAASEHSLAVLLGKAPAEFSMVADPIAPVNLRVPPGLPSSLLERRPDIAAAERSMAAANSRIGIAKAAFFPSLTITGTGGFESATIGDLFKWSSRAFLLGPLAGTALNIPIFDGGRRKGNLANARAVYEEDVANYRQQVLVAFREVEDNLSDMRILEDQTKTQNEAVTASQRAADLSRSQYTEGAVNYLDVIDAERTVLQARRSAVQLQGVQAASTVNLIRALGGGWGDVVPQPVQPAIGQVGTTAPVQTAVAQK
ncbi:efflux transporter outer membrane subunit [Paraburkholderia metrosideri]|jgi:multidrug efflux system outer membrane protein|uniref:Outer membrane protein OprM n=1 Tax=Paraburkholderia metrosideri TaxID=580937 RepID=A0ABM8NCN9_9BURK|nr:efflux transporter outer membrane subunit [Paraburkholderia metrosideri]CAD6517523.1 Outer membrane protein OprM [Paraburkholderia metrosideri]